MNGRWIALTSSIPNHLLDRTEGNVEDIVVPTSFPIFLTPVSFSFGPLTLLFFFLLSPIAVLLISMARLISRHSKQKAMRELFPPRRFFPMRLLPILLLSLTTCSTSWGRRLSLEEQIGVLQTALKTAENLDQKCTIAVGTAAGTQVRESPGRPGVLANRPFDAVS